MAERAEAPARGPARAWVAIVLGMGGAWAWVHNAGRIAALIPVPSIEAAAVLFYALLFVPLIAWALLLGNICHVPVWQLGARPGMRLAQGLAVGAAGIVMTTGLAWLHGGLGRGQVPGGAGSILLLAGAITFVQVLAEELLCRGWLQPVLVRLLGPAGGIALGAALFATLHLAGGPISLQALGNLLLGGVLFGVLAWRGGGIAAPVGAHFAWNVIEDTGFGLVPNPGIGPLGALADLEIAGAAMWGGGTEGLNASIGTTLVLIALILPWMATRRG
jgi:hypothetical protein